MDPSELDDLYAGPLDAFVERRNDLAKALKRAGRKEDAAEVKKLKKPSLGAWAINQLVRHEPGVLTALFTALDRVRAAQLGGTEEDDRPALATAMAEERDALHAVGDTAERLLTEAGHAATKPNLDRIARSVRAAAVEPSRREELLRGQLTEDVADAGFSDLAAQLAGAMVPAKPKAEPVRRSPGTDAAPRRAPPRATPKARSDERANDTTDRAMPANTIDLDAERKRREAIEAEARAKARRDRIERYRGELKALRIGEEKLEKDAAQAALEVSRVEERLVRARELKARADERLANARAQRNELEEALAALERPD